MEISIKHLSVKSRIASNVKREIFAQDVIQDIIQTKIHKIVYIMENQNLQLIANQIILLKVLVRYMINLQKSALDAVKIIFQCKIQNVTKDVKINIHFIKLKIMEMFVFNVQLGVLHVHLIQKNTYIVKKMLSALHVIKIILDQMIFAQKNATTINISQVILNNVNKDVLLVICLYLIKNVLTSVQMGFIRIKVLKKFALIHAKIC
ncbi:hypothetical protein TTHERM_000647248 (macronuclear) [Tetrahymena thermophila SB210]|uniref:Uncharacterized protein n=1 Tax=Tetrahymena thermophila (strain SB210) TaxID=312017 RepID=W7XE12_TETTS|nr:hypothetical protein TTHERM_000647248 [Tetrahymena thermophila SB210]EWS71089.1 hypothetical protein TTHERM_000647248 [Tetrahymena thermophila SB210]|eukprot:XP_012656388.1 hypothetical protein TTHERM_000647248 [Tetrahymena thermophila SB210]